MQGALRSAKVTVEELLAKHKQQEERRWEVSTVLSEQHDGTTCMMQYGRPAQRCCVQQVLSPERMTVLAAVASVLPTE